MQLRSFLFTGEKFDAGPTPGRAREGRLWSRRGDRRTRSHQGLFGTRSLGKWRLHRIQQQHPPSSGAVLVEDRPEGPFVPLQDHLVAGQLRRRSLQLGAPLRTARLRSGGTSAQKRKEKAAAATPDQRATARRLRTSGVLRRCSAKTYTTRQKPALLRTPAFQSFARTKL